MGTDFGALLPFSLILSDADCSYQREINQATGRTTAGLCAGA